MSRDRTNGFDPAAHLVKQGWKGKGTAFKPGHATRHLATVKKRDLGGLGKNRDEAQPFWDHIFATTAASLSLPSSGTSTPLTPASPSPAPGMDVSKPSMGGASRPSGASWQTQSTPTISTSARVGREVARRGLYSRFFRGSKTSAPPEEEEDEREVEQRAETVAGPSAKPMAVTTLAAPGDKASERQGRSGKEKAKESKEETKEERRARRAEKKRRKEEKAARSRRASADSDVGESLKPDTIAEKPKKRRREDEAGKPSLETAPETIEGGNGKQKRDRSEGEEREKKRKKKDGTS